MRLFIKNYSSFTSKSSMLTYSDVCDDISTFVFMFFFVMHCTFKNVEREKP